MEKFKKSKNNLILLDYDGTLVEYNPIPQNATPSPRLLHVLNKLITRPNTKVILISGRSSDDMEIFFGNFPIDIIAEHGALIRENFVWRKTLAIDFLWKTKVLELMIQKTKVCQESFIEEKEHSLAWHYRNSQMNKGYSNSRELLNSLKDVAIENNLKVFDGNKVIEVVSMNIGKGIATKEILSKNNYDYIISIGDDKTDEEMFYFLLELDNADTFKVGQGNTLAKYKLKDITEVISYLEQLTSL